MNIYYHRIRDSFVLYYLRTLNNSSSSNNSSACVICFMFNTVMMSRFFPRYKVVLLGDWVELYCMMSSSNPTFWHFTLRGRCKENVLVINSWVSPSFCLVIRLFYYISDKIVLLSCSNVSFLYSPRPSHLQMQGGPKMAHATISRRATDGLTSGGICIAYFLSYNAKGALIIW